MPLAEHAGQALQQWSPRLAKPVSEIDFICCKVVLYKAIGPQKCKGDKEN